MWLPPATIEDTNVSTLRPGRAPPMRPRSLTVTLISLETETHHQGGDEEQPGVGHQARLVEGHRQPIDPARY
jgi:hypothetical protein